MDNEALNEAVRQAQEAAQAAGAAADQARLAAEQAARIALGHDASLDAAGAAVHVATGGVIDPFVFRLSIFVLAIFVGYYVVWSVTPALHTPLMSVTNAISSVIVVGALIAAAAAGSASSKWLGLVAVALASVNIFGGFAVTARMLSMYKKRERQGDKTHG